MYLAELALAFAVKHLKPGGSLLVKVFQGSGFQEFLREMRGWFNAVVTRKPDASRGRSNELYLLGRELRDAAKVSVVRTRAGTNI
jgi:23S rRNA (uridine2552-2'-O)-methyltransferase